jgi:hypothetical protein
MVVAEILSAHQTTLEKRLGGSVSANKTAVIFEFGFHGRRREIFSA